MTPEQFAYWLNGFFEMVRPKVMDSAQVTMVKKHLALVMTNVRDERASQFLADDVKPKLIC